MTAIAYPVTEERIIKYTDSIHVFICVICKQDVTRFITSPSSSDYPYETICDRCFHEYLDPVIPAAIEVEKAKNG